MEADKKKAKGLFLLWAVLYFAQGLVSVAYVTYQRAFFCYNPVAIFTGYQIFIFCMVAFFFLPFLWVVVRRLKAAQMKILHGIALALLWLMAIWTAVMGLCMILEVLIPNLF